MDEGALGGAPSYSKAFDNIVQDEQDVVGLLAYALLKRSIREDAEKGRRSDGSIRDPSPTVVTTYRQAAERQLEEIITRSLEAARPELQSSAMLDALDSIKSNLREHMTQRTGFLPALLTNVLAWAFTLLITVLILFAFSRPDPAQTITKAAARLVPAPENPAER